MRSIASYPLMAHLVRGYDRHGDRHDVRVAGCKADENVDRHRGRRGSAGIDNAFSGSCSKYGVATVHDAYYVVLGGWGSEARVVARLIVQSVKYSKLSITQTHPQDLRR